MGYGLKQHGVASVNETTCIGCGQCAEICPDEVLVMDGGRPKAGRGVLLGCIACGHCTAICPTGSIAISGRGSRGDDRTAMPAAAPATIDAMESLMTARRSIRRYKQQEVPRAILDRIVQATSTAPMGLPPSEIGLVIFPTRQKVQQFAEESCRSFDQAARFLNPFVLALMRPFVGKVQYEGFRDFIRPLMKFLPEMRRKGRDWFTYDAPAAMLFHYGPESDPFDCAIAVTYAMLAAESLGLGSCMLGTSVALNQNRRFKARYGVPAENKFSVTLILGYPAVEFHAAVRRRLASVKYVE